MTATKGMTTMQLSKRYKMRIIASVLITAGILFVSSLPYLVLSHYGLYLNTTSSMPLGLWRASPFDSLQDQRETIVFVKKDILPINSKLVKNRYLLKRIKGIAGDIVDYDSRSQCIRINGRTVHASSIFSSDKYGDRLPVPQYPYTIPPGHYYLSSDNIFGYDSRYFGTVPSSSILAAATLVWRYDK